MGVKPEDINVDDVKFTLTTPCNDCPFLRDTPCHDGIFQSLDSVSGAIDHGNVIHSCHKTHPGADGFVEGYTGPVQHCAGLMIMLEKADRVSYPMFFAAEKNEYDHTKLDMTANVFSDEKEMLTKYLTHYANPEFAKEHRKSRFLHITIGHPEDRMGELKS